MNGIKSLSDLVNEIDKSLDEDTASLAYWCVHDDFAHFDDDQTLLGYQINSADNNLVNILIEQRRKNQDSAELKNTHWFVTLKKSDERFGSLLKNKEFANSFSRGSNKVKVASCCAMIHQKNLSTENAAKFINLVRKHFSFKVVA